jgi:hypothetical protein
MDTQKLAFKGIIFISIGILLLHGLAAVSQSWAPDSTSVFLTIDQKLFDDLIKHQDTAEAIVLGNSHGDDLDTSVMRINSFQLSRAWGDFFEIKYYLEYLVPRLPKLDTVYIPVSYFSFYWDNASGGKLSIRRAQLYTIVPSWTYIKGDFGNFISGSGDRIIPVQAVVREDNWKGVISALISGKPDKLSQETEQNCQYRTEEELTRISILRVEETLDIAQVIHTNRPSIVEDSYKVLTEIIDYLHTHEIRVIFFTPPYYETYTTAYLERAPQAVESLKIFMNQIKNEYSIDYHDYSTNGRYAQNHQLFKDSDHLNLCGKQMFSRELIELSK